MLKQLCLGILICTSAQCEYKSPTRRISEEIFGEDLYLRIKAVAEQCHSCNSEECKRLKAEVIDAIQSDPEIHKRLEKYRDKVPVIQNFCACWPVCCTDKGKTCIEGIRLIKEALNYEIEPLGAPSPNVKPIKPKPDLFFFLSPTS